MLGHDASLCLFILAKSGQLYSQPGPPPLLFKPPEEQDIFSEHKKFGSPQDLLRSGGGQGDKIC